MLRVLARLLGLSSTPSKRHAPVEPRRTEPVLKVEITTDLGRYSSETVDSGPLTETAAGWVLNPRCSFKVTLTGIARARAAEVKALLDEPSMHYHEGRKRLAGLFAQHNVGWKELDDYVAEFKPRYLASIERQKAESLEWQVASEPDRRDMLEGFRPTVLASLDVRPYGDVEVLFEDDLADVTMDDRLLEAYGMDLMAVYLRRSGNLERVHRVEAQAYDRQACEQLVEKGLALRGSDIPLEHVLLSLTLKELNALAAAPKPFGRKAKAVEYLLSQPNLSDRIAGAVALREMFQLRPLPAEFSSIDLGAVSRSWRRAAEIGGLLAHTYSMSISALRHVQNSREYVDGWQILATDDSCPACVRAAKKKYPKSKPPTVPVHLGCRCCLTPVIR